MKDLISYCQNIETLRTELIEGKYLTETEDEETEAPVFPLPNKTPTRKSQPPKTITLIRCITDDDETLLRSFKSIEVLGTYEEVFDDDDKYKKYSEAYPHDPYTVKDPETGEEMEITPPKKFGVFA